jgi:hypothetical protein
MAYDKAHPAHNAIRVRSISSLLWILRFCFRGLFASALWRTPFGLLQHFPLLRRQNMPQP